MNGKVINVFSGKGGVGKTTLAINLGWILSEIFNKEVTIVDCNVTTSHLGLYLGIYYVPVTLNKILKGEYKIEEAIQVYSKRLKIIPASNSVSDLENIDIFTLSEVIRPLRETNDIIILDSAPGLGREALGSLRVSDEILFITIPYIPAVMDIVRTNELIKELNLKPLGIVLNMVNNDRFELNESEVQQITGLPILAKLPFEREMRKSLYFNSPLVYLNKRTKFAKEVSKLAALLIGEKYEEETFIKRLRKFLRF